MNREGREDEDSGQTVMPAGYDALSVQQRHYQEADECGLRQYSSGAIHDHFSNTNDGG